MSVVQAVRERSKKNRVSANAKAQQACSATSIIEEQNLKQQKKISAITNESDVATLLESINTNMCRLEQLVQKGEVAQRDNRRGSAVRDLVHHVSTLLKQTEHMIAHKECPAGTEVQKSNENINFTICANRSKYRRLVVPNARLHT